MEPASEQELRQLIQRPRRGRDVRSHGREPVETDAPIDFEPVQRATCSMADMPPLWGSKYSARIFYHTLTDVATIFRSLRELIYGGIINVLSVKFIA